MIWKLIKTGFGWALDNWQLVLGVIVLFAVMSFALYVRSVFYERDRLKADLEQIAEQIDHNKIQAEKLLKQREQENADLAEKWRQYARKSDDNYEAKMAGLRSPNSSGLRLYTGCGDGSELAGSSKTASAATPEKPAPESGTSDAAPEVVFGLAEIGQVLQWYAYGQSCHAFVNAK